MKIIFIIISLLIVSGCDDDASQNNSNNTINNNNINNSTNNTNNTNNNNTNNTNNTLNVGTLTFETGGVPVRTGGDNLVLTDKAWDEEYTATVSVDTSQSPSHPVEKGIGGINMEAQFGGFNVMTGYDLDLDVAQQMRSLNLAGKTVRWPGGGYDTLDYAGCIGDPHARPLQSFFGTDQQCTFGPQEANELAQITESELWMQLQPMLVDPGLPDTVITHSAFPVYNHNSGEAGTINSPVINWEIGNEQYALSADDYSAMDFVSAAVPMISAMRQEDPSIKIWVPLFLNYSNNFFSTQSDWNRVIIENLAHLVDGFSVHNGYAPIVPSASSADDVADAYKSMFSNALWVEENMQDIRDLVVQYADENAPDLKFAITEMNAAYGIFPGEHNMMNHVQTLASAAYFASMLGTYAQMDDVTHVHAFTGVQFTTMGLLGVTDGTYTSTPDTHSGPALVLSQWNAWAEGNVLSNIEVTSPTFSSKTLGWMEQINSIPYLFAFVIKSTDDSTLKIMLVNRSLTQSARVNLQITGFEPSETIVSVVTGFAADSNPGLTIPDVVNPAQPAEFARFSSGAVGEIWITSEEGTFMNSIRIPPASVVFLTAL